MEDNPPGGRLIIIQEPQRKGSPQGANFLQSSRRDGRLCGSGAETYEASIKNNERLASGDLFNMRIAFLFFLKEWQ